MEISDFDQHTLYLKIPPSIQYPNYTDFYTFYAGIHTTKVSYLLKLRQYCTDMAKQGLKPDSIVLGGPFLQKADTKVPVEAIFVFPVDANHGSSALKEYCTRFGTQADKFKSSILPLNYIKKEAKDVLSAAPIRELQKRHDKADKCLKVGLVALNFSEVIK